VRLVQLAWVEMATVVLGGVDNLFSVMCCIMSSIYHLLCVPHKDCSSVILYISPLSHTFTGVKALEREKIFSLGFANENC